MDMSLSRMLMLDNSHDQGVGVSGWKALPSTLLKGGSWTRASDELGRVAVKELTITQLTWMLHNKKLSGEVHGVAERHEEAAGDDSSGSEVNTSMDASAPSQPSMPPKRGGGQAMTGDAGASMHQPNRAQTSSP